jgi:hypothetical protein
MRAFGNRSRRLGNAWQIRMVLAMILVAVSDVEAGARAQALCECERSARLAGR